MTPSPLFWVFALALVAATLALLLLPLLRRGAAPEAPADESAATAVFRDHKRQVDADFAAGTITAEERDASLAELTQRFGAELTASAPPPAAAGGERSRFVAALVLVACVPVAAGVLYFAIGNPSAMTAASAKAPSLNDPQIAAMVDGLAKRLQANPEDGKGWALLGRSYRVLGRYDAAAMAYSEAARRLPADADLYADWAETVAQVQGRSLGGQPTELLEQAIKVDPNNVKALALLGSAAMERGDVKTAAELWTRLRAGLPPDSPLLGQIDEALARAGAAPAAGARAATAPGPLASAATSPQAPSAAAAGSAVSRDNAAAATGGATVEGRVELDPRLAKNVAPGDTVFIFARDPDGPRMPLAAMKVAAADLPRSFVLSDAMAMSPAATISKAAKVIVEARVSKSGNVRPQSGDLAGSSAPVAPGARGVKVTIDQVVP